MAEAEEECFDKFGGPEYQKLISSIIHFDNDSEAITPESARRLDRVSQFVIDSDRFSRVVVSGHTDDNASHAYNLALSERRADITGQYMVDRGVDAQLIEKHFFGETLPAKPNNSDANRAYNRRAHIDLKEK